MNPIRWLRTAIRELKYRFSTDYRLKIEASCTPLRPERRVKPGFIAPYGTGDGFQYALAHMAAQQVMRMQQQPSTPLTARELAEIQAHYNAARAARDRMLQQRGLGSSFLGGLGNIGGGLFPRL